MVSVDRLIEVWYESAAEFGQALEDFVNNLPPERARFWGIDLWLWLQHQRDLGLIVDYASFQRLRRALDAVRDEYIAEGVSMLSTYTPSAEQTAREQAGIRARNEGAQRPVPIAPPGATSSGEPASPTQSAPPSPAPSPTAPQKVLPAPKPNSTLSSLIPFVGSIATRAFPPPNDSTTAKLANDTSLAGKVRYAVVLANRKKMEVEQQLLRLGELTDGDADPAAIESQFTVVERSVNDYEQHLIQALMAGSVYLLHSGALARDADLQTAVLNLTLIPGGIPVSRNAYSEWKNYSETIDQVLRDSDARLTTARNYARATEIAGNIAGIATGGLETAAAEGGKQAIKYVIKETGKYLLREAVDYALDRYAARGAPEAEVVDKIRRARTAYFILRSGRWRFDARVGVKGGKDPKPPNKAKAIDAGDTSGKGVGPNKAVRPKSSSGDTDAAAAGKEIHKNIANSRRASGEFDLVQSAITDKNGNPILVSKKIYLKTGRPRKGEGVGRSIPDAVSFRRNLIMDDKPLGRSISKDREQIIRYIRAYEKREGHLPHVIAIGRYDPTTMKPVLTELYSPIDFLP